MRNTLKFLLGTMCCTMMLNNYCYSMDEGNDKNDNPAPVVQPISQNDSRIANITINSNVDEITKLASTLRSERKQTRVNLEKENVFDKAYEYYSLLKDILMNYDLKSSQIKDINSDYSSTVADVITKIFDNQTYIDFLKDTYEKFKETKYSEQEIEEFATKLLQNNLEFISQYSPRTTANYLFVAAWNILYRYVNENKMSKLSNTINSLLPKFGKHANIYVTDKWYA